MTDIISKAQSLPVNGNSMTLFLCGDVMTGRGIDQVLPNPGDPIIHENYLKSALGYVALAEKANGSIPRPVSFEYIWGEALAVLASRAPHLRVINLETSITSSDDFWPHKGINYRMHPGNTPVLNAAGIDCCVLANNHVLDWGYSGLSETLESLQQADLKIAGAGLDLDHASAPAVFKVPGKSRVIIFSVASESSGVPFKWAATENRPGVNFISDFSTATIDHICDQVKAVKQAGDIVVLSIHWGGNWGYDVPRRQRKFAHQLIDNCNVDVIHGHSSHHPRGVELYRRKPIIYGCGDFINDYEGIGGQESYRGDLRLMYFLETDPANGNLVGMDMLPLQMRNFRLYKPSRQDVVWLQRTLHREGQKFDTPVTLSANGQYLHISP